jgi:hypothetical protein
MKKSILAIVVFAAVVAWPFLVPPTPARASYPITNIRASATNSGAQTIPNSSGTVLTFNTNTYDTAGIHSTVSNTSRFTVPAGQGGNYLATCQVTWATNSDVTNIRALALSVNGTGTAYQVTGVGSATFQLSQLLPALLVMSAGDYMECSVFQASGGNLNTVAANTFGSLIRLN